MVIYLDLIVLCEIKIYWFNDIIGFVVSKI